MNWEKAGVHWESRYGLGESFKAQTKISWEIDYCGVKTIACPKTSLGIPGKWLTSVFLPRLWEYFKMYPACQGQVYLMKICCFPLCLLKAEVLVLLWAKKLGWCTAVSDELLILLLLTPQGLRNPGPATCAFSYSKKILEKDLPQQRNKSSEVHFIFLTQMGKWEFREDWRRYTLVYPMVACRNLPTLMKWNVSSMQLEYTNT